MRVNRPLIFSAALIFASTGLFAPYPIKSSDDIFSAWQTSTNFPYQLANHTSFTHSDRIYAVNGSAQTGASKKSVISSLISQDGSLSSWNDINANTPEGLIMHTTVTKDNKIYILGGKVEPSGIGNSVDFVLVGNLNSDGSIAGWTSLNSLPKRLSKGKAVIVNNRIYFVGGATWTNSGNPVPSDTVYFANINADGTIGNWTSTTSLPTPLSGHGLIEANGKIITLGGSIDAGETPINKTYSAPVNADGTLGSWSQGPNLPVGLRDGGAVKIGAFAIYAGGYSGQLSDKVYYSAIDAGGNLGTWMQSANNLPVTLCCGSLAVWYNRLYLSGGHDGANYLNSVYTVATTAVPAPTPLPSINVPDIKQYSPPWNDDVYDQANIWSASPTIERWGCALTSAAMVLKYYGHNTNPDTLNNWLTSQPDGYIRNGLLNWLAVSRYTRLHDSPASPTLEYRRLGSNTANLVSELMAGRPAILEQPGHYMVGKSQTADSFGINDPAYADRTTLAAYANSFSGLSSYRPTHTDLSYIMFVVDQDVNVSLVDSGGNPVALDQFLQPPLVDDVSGMQSSSETVKIYLLPTPALDDYTAQLSGTPSSYQLNVYVYDSQGNTTPANLSGLLGSGEDKYKILLLDSGQIEPVVSIDSILADLDTGYKLGLVKRSAYTPLKRGLTEVKKLIARRRITAARGLLKSLAISTSTLTPMYVEPHTSQILKGGMEKLVTDL